MAAPIKPFKDEAAILQAAATLAAAPYAGETQVKAAILVAKLTQVLSAMAKAGLIPPDRDPLPDTSPKGG
jgi:hypothetical protein